MEKIFPFFTALMLLPLLASECGKEELQIVYPASGDYGENILSAENTSIVSSGAWTPHSYSMRAELPEETSLTVIINLTSNAGNWSSDEASRAGWEISTLSPRKQQFLATAAQNCDLDIRFYDHGAANIEFYENGSTDTTGVKSISW
jgi:hypothetical protein